jgi:hypothetical protein
MEFNMPLGKGSGIAIEDGVFKPELCQEIIQFVYDHPHLAAPGRTMGGHMNDVKRSTDVSIDGRNDKANEEERAVLARFETELLEAYRLHLQKYFEVYGGMPEWQHRTDTGYQYQRYTKGDGFYKAHIDGAPYSKDSGRSNDRVLASVFYFNTIEVGGGTHFDYFDFTCDAVEGRCVTFPTTFLHLHGGLVPESDDKHIVSTFVLC